jgi:hypothetical protein
MNAPLTEPHPMHCQEYISAAILDAARAAVPADVERLVLLPDCGPRNKPLMPLLIGLVEALKVTAVAVADNAWDERYPIDDRLALELRTALQTAEFSLSDATTAAKNSTGPMVYEITYRKDNATHQLEWIAPENWTTTAVRRAFYEQFPQSQIISLEAMP